MSDDTTDQIKVTKAFFGVEKINYKDKYSLVIQGNFRNENMAVYFDF